MFDSSQCDDTWQNELIMKEESDMTMNVDESDTHQTWMIRFADSKEKNKTIDKLTSLTSKTKNVWLTDIFHHAAEENSI